MEPMKNIPVYRHSAAYAVEHGELEAYKMSRVAGVACRDAIEKAVAKHYRDNCLNKAGAREVIDEFWQRARDDGAGDYDSGQALRRAILVRQ